ncbi:hypothetical protein GH741_11335 [Aquibacillus halophilus]|uniref:Uncharacterized protein n=1 Tax=Aquibacillus halophilus TaxID=930132 RepID=A0A6A8DC58_9BACI|nr:hypothetical protein [Aquibacillus halophilus]MRH43273.1 hypothetical protein [Aquibacillus halophilus]
MKNLLMYLCWSIVLIVLLYSGGLVQINLLEHQNTTHNILPNFTFSFLFPLFLGMSIRFSYFFSDRERDKKWTFNWKKLLGIGFPLLLIAMGPFIFFIIGLPTIDSLLPGFYLSNFSSESIAGLICGFVVVDSLRESK